MSKEDIVLMKFPFTDLTGSKLRPALVLIETLSDLTVAHVIARGDGWRELTCRAAM